jgi:hypothetical protein
MDTRTTFTSCCKVLKEDASQWQSIAPLAANG